MRQELPYPQLGPALGGNQNWFDDFAMHGGGCGAVTACDVCLCLALNQGLSRLVPFPAEEAAPLDFVRFGMAMKPYLSPRRRGIDTLEAYIDGLSAYWADAGCPGLRADPLPGAAPLPEAREAVRRQLDAAIPVPCLLLRHQNPDFDDYVWHWFNLAGYREEGDDFLVKAVTYGRARWLSLKALWDTGFPEKGGLVLIHLKGETAPPDSPG